MFDIPMLQAGCFATERILNKDGSTTHPTQKPELLMRQLLKVGGDTILDPFMGSGTTGVACVQTGRNFIGCEISPEYFRIAEKRIREAQAQPRIPFDPTYESGDSLRKESQGSLDFFPNHESDDSN